MRPKSETGRKVKDVPEGYHTVTPFIIAKGAADLIEFLTNGFGALELSRMTDEDGKIGHAEVRIGDSVIMLFDSKEGWPETPSFLRIYVEDCDDMYQQALHAGGRSVTNPTNMPWGDRVCRIGDPFGNIWWIMTRIEEVKPEVIERRYREKEDMDAMQYVQEADFFPTMRQGNWPSGHIK
jgi:PhnB protein